MWLILADDLTGAADCAIAFARRGVGAVVGWDHAEATGPVFAYNADSRELTAEATILRHRQVLARLAGRRVFAKIDSTLRGQPAAAIAAALSADTIGVLAPAFPAAGRTTEGARVRVGGAPLETTELWRRDHGYASADLVGMLATRSLIGHHLPLATVRSAELAVALRAIPPGEVAVCDALEQSDLARVARAAPANACCIGSAGLAHALADTQGAASGDAPVSELQRMPAMWTSRGTLVVVGSMARISREAAQVLARLEDVRRFSVRPDAVSPDLGSAVAASLARGLDVLLELELPDGAGARTSRQAAAALAHAVASAAAHIGALVATGGETAAALLHACGIHGIRLHEEPEPGVSFGVTLGAIEVPLATKAGAFGDRETLVRIVRRLRRSRQLGRDG